MKKVLLITLTCVLSFASISSYAATTEQQSSNVCQVSQDHCNDSNDGRIKEFTAPNLVDDPRVNNS